MKRSFFTFFVFLSTLLLQSDALLSILEKIHQNNVLKVIIQEKEPYFYTDFDMQQGLHYDLVQSFAKKLGVSVKLITIENVNEVPHLLKTGQGDLALVGNISTNNRSQTSLLSDPYLQTRQMLACKRGGKIPNKDDDFRQVSLLIPNHILYSNNLPQELGEVSNKWILTNDSIYEIFQRLSSQKSGCLLVNEKDFLVLRRYFPEIKEVKLFDQQWGISAEFPKYAMPLQKVFNKWLASNSQWIASLEDVYYERLNDLTYADLKIFHYRIQTRLPKFLKLFKEAGKRYQLPWQLLAAQAYQESHWNPRARSKTGVRGVMMLTKLVAKELQVNRLNPIQSIFGGTRYLKKLLKRVPKNVKEKDKIWFALAAYNVGMGHVRGAQKLAEKAQKDSGSWRDVRSVLPKLAKKKYYKTLKYGYARGYEAVTYVRRIREFYAILLQYQNQRPVSPNYL